MCTCVHVCACVCMYVCACVRTCAHACTFLYMSVRVCTYAHVCAWREEDTCWVLRGPGGCCGALCPGPHRLFSETVASGAWPAGRQAALVPLQLQGEAGWGWGGEEGGDGEKLTVTEHVSAPAHEVACPVGKWWPGCKLCPHAFLHSPVQRLEGPRGRRREGGEEVPQKKAQPLGGRWSAGEP